MSLGPIDTSIRPNPPRPETDAPADTALDVHASNEADGTLERARAWVAGQNAEPAVGAAPAAKPAAKPAPAPDAQAKPAPQRYPTAAQFEAGKAEAQRQMDASRETAERELTAAAPAFKKGAEAIITNFETAKSPEAQTAARDLAKQQLKQPGAVKLPPDVKKKLEAVSQKLEAGQLQPLVEATAQPPLSDAQKQMIASALDENKHLAGQGNYVALELAIQRPISAPASAVAGQAAEKNAAPPRPAAPTHVSAADQKRADDAADAARQARHSAIMADVKNKPQAAEKNAAPNKRSAAPAHVSAADQKRADDAADAARQARHSAIIADVKTKAAGALGEAAKQLRAHPDAAIDKRDLQARLDAANKADINAGPDVETLTRALAPPAPFKGVNLDEKAAFDALNARALMALQPAKLREMFDELEEVGAIAPNNEK